MADSQPEARSKWFRRHPVKHPHLLSPKKIRTALINKVRKAFSPTPPPAKPFRLLDLPLELVMDILEMATDPFPDLDYHGNAVMSHDMTTTLPDNPFTQEKPKEAIKTIKALRQTSFRMHRLAAHAINKHLQIMSDKEEGLRDLVLTNPLWRSRPRDNHPQQVHLDMYFLDRRNPPAVHKDGMYLSREMDALAKEITNREKEWRIDVKKKWVVGGSGMNKRTPEYRINEYAGDMRLRQIVLAAMKSFRHVRFISMYHFPARGIAP